jgi:hemerythrin-like metal-binding protein
MLLMWTGNLSVGVKDFDEDHRRMIRIINELHGVIQDVDAQGKIPVEEIEIALHRLENYVSTHCLKEEGLMAKTGFPELAEHQQEHVKFAAVIKDMQQRFRNSTDPKQAAELMEYLYEYLTNHIFVTDRKYSSHLHLKGYF